MGKLASFLIRRILLSVAVLFTLSVVVFSISRLSGDPIAAYVGPQASREFIETVRNQYHLNDPLYVQYFYWLFGVLRGDLGISQTFGYRPVTFVIISFLPVTLELALYTMLISLPASIWLATKSAMNKDKWIDHASRLFAIAGYSLPIFVFGLVLALILYPLGVITFNPNFNFPVITGLPTIDALLALNWPGFVESWRYLVGPLAVQVFVQLALNVRILRASMVEEASKDYVTTGLSKGFSRSNVFKRYVRRNALIPFVTLAGTQFASLISGTVVNEVVFNRKGLGFMIATSAIANDHNAVLAYALVVGVAFVIINIIVDIIYSRLDPRIRLGG
jgi:dipeptide transport system permease protein